VHGVTFQKAVIATAMIASNLTTQTLAGTARLPTARHILCTERNVWNGTNNSYDGVRSNDGFADKYTNSFIP
jgi:hypothetical protein